MMREVGKLALWVSSDKERKEVAENPKSYEHRLEVAVAQTLQSTYAVVYDVPHCISANNLMQTTSRTRCLSSGLRKRRKLLVP